MRLPFIRLEFHSIYEAYKKDTSSLKWFFEGLKF